MAGPTFWILLALFAAVSDARQDASPMANIKADSKPLPVVLWHGMGDSCCADFSMGAVAKQLEKSLGVYVHSIATGSGMTADIWSSYFGNLNDQVAAVCQELRGIEELKDGYNAIGFSQGGQFMRAVIERCQHLGPKAKTFITMGSQHQGVSNIPGCGTINQVKTGQGLESNDTPGSSIAAGATVKAAATAAVAAVDQATTWKSACQTMQMLLGKGAYKPWVRSNVVQAQYFKDPARLDDYMRYNIFLPDINNERQDKTQQYKKNLASLERLVLLRFTEDDMVVPRDSSWFSFVDSQGVIVPLRDQPLYSEDWIGLRELDDADKIVMDDVPGKHMQFSMQWFEDNVISKYLRA